MHSVKCYTSWMVLNTHKMSKYNKTIFFSRIFLYLTTVLKGNNVTRNFILFKKLYLFELWEKTPIRIII